MAATNTFSGEARNFGMSAQNAFIPTNHDTNEITFQTRGLYVGGAGDVKCLLVGDTVAVVFVAVPAGTLLPIRVKQIFSTGTTATSLLGLY